MPGGTATPGARRSCAGGHSRERCSGQRTPMRRLADGTRGLDRRRQFLRRPCHGKPRRRTPHAGLGPGRASGAGAAHWQPEGEPAPSPPRAGPWPQALHVGCREPRRALPRLHQQDLAITVIAVVVSVVYSGVGPLTVRHDCPLSNNLLVSVPSGSVSLSFDLGTMPVDQSCFQATIVPLWKHEDSRWTRVLLRPGCVHVYLYMALLFFLYLL